MSTNSTTPISGTAFSTPMLARSDSSVSSSTEYSGVDPAAIDDALLRNLLTDIDLEDVQDTLISIAKHAGVMMLAGDPSVSTAETKMNSADLVTAIDKAVEDMVKKTLMERFPGFLFLGEETLMDGQTLSDDPTFVCDPIDGTLNYIHGFHHYCISLALTVAKQPVVAVVYAPAMDHLYTAIKGHGAYLTRPGGRRVALPFKQTPEPLKTLKTCIVALEMGKERKGPNWALRSDMAKKLITAKEEGGAMAQSFRTNGSCALSFCFVAAGQLDICWESGCYIWDVCAGWLINEEAGGIIAGANPGEWKPTLEGRSYFPVRPAPSGQKEIVQELWSYMDGKSFVY